MPIRTPPYGLGPNQDTATTLNFTPKSVVINNTSNFWVNLPQLGTAGWVPPSTLGVLKHWINEKTVEFRSDLVPFAAPPVTNPAGQASIVFEEQEGQESAGFSYGSFYAISQKLGSFTVTGSVVGKTQSFKLPPNIQAILVDCTIFVLNGGTVINITGDQSGRTYYPSGSLVGATNPYLFAVYVDPSADISISIFVITGSGGTSSLTCTVSALGAPLQTWVRQIPGETFGVGLIKQSSGLVLIGQQLMSNSLPVVIASDQTAIPTDTTDRIPRQLGRISVLSIEAAANTIITAAFATALGAGGTAVLVSGIVGQRIYNLQLNVEVVTLVAALVNLEDTTPFAIGNIRTDVALADNKKLYGRSSNVGAGMQLGNHGGGAAGTIAGELVCIQQ
jgi:hypothetical protein